ncbi:hypothetical protein [Wolbachia endosymbiont (group B) of Chorthippus parallelus]|uniref:hypothetical protein n=1 Tax=Wolbachia endosymbiont (group B) of Chorthippus parallelus TaxID=2953997 RepID=UPI0022318F0B|nr:hypothetical protein [Wolbachia endosymbiont (group B) of Chorthippus parallelus]
MRYDVSFGLAIVEVKTHPFEGVDFLGISAGVDFGSDNSVFTLVGSNGVSCSSYNAPHKLDQKKMVDPSRKVKG